MKRRVQPFLQPDSNPQKEEEEEENSFFMAFYDATLLEEEVEADELLAKRVVQ